ncbi:hypothetical protein M9H77_27108 [Catharanthus roseus]|uniref:Uncharacterized protein n=1 Tax=Catharanthus roseus TaxID=4058 RepID=A0ACC0ABR7_CATRO|nr:hypothetical protein M9H77_27108 [Catharanthus roseus]
MIGSTDRVRNLKWGHRNKFRHSVVNTSLNSEGQCINVTSPGIPTRPSCATLAGEPFLTQPARKYPLPQSMIRSRTEYRLRPNPPTVLRPLSTGSRSRVTLPNMSFGRGLVQGTSHAQCRSSRHVDQKCIPSPFLPN